MRKKGYWFVARRYGLGWTPATWEGWVIVIVYVYTMTMDILAATHSNGFVLLRYVLFAFFLTIFFVAVCVVTGEVLSWKWGNKRTK